MLSLCYPWEREPLGPEESKGCCGGSPRRAAHPRPAARLRAGAGRHSERGPGGTHGSAPALQQKPPGAAPGNAGTAARANHSKSPARGTPPGGSLPPRPPQPQASTPPHGGQTRPRSPSATPRYSHLDPPPRGNLGRRQSLPAGRKEAKAAARAEDKRGPRPARERKAGWGRDKAHRLATGRRRPPSPYPRPGRLGTHHHGCSPRSRRRPSPPGRPQPSGEAGLRAGAGRRRLSRGSGGCGRLAPRRPLPLCRAGGVEAGAAGPWWDLGSAGRASAACRSAFAFLLSG